MGDAAEMFSRGRSLVVRKPTLVLVGVVAALLLVDLARDVATGAVAVSSVTRLVWRGVVNGLVIGLAGVGLSMTYSILNFANFAHGEYVTTGAFGGWAAAFVVAGLGVADVGSLVTVGAGGTVYASELGTSVVNTPLAIVAGIVAAGVAGVALALAVDRLVYKPMRGEGGISLLIASVGVAFVLRYLLVLAFGRRAVTVVGGSSPKIGVPFLPITLGVHEITLVVCAVALMAGVHVVLQYSKLGKAMRAMSDNEDLARVTGIPAERVIRWTWMIGGGLAGVAGYLLILESGTIAFNRGWILLLLIFAAVILGGIGSIYGAILGGLVIGIADAISLLWLPPDFTQAAAFALMILILLFRPQGLFAGRSTA